ncbi:MAG: ABC transporter ATP-binding protein [Cellulosilyticum sp.]|nr:ABC transporter ATP-binding protein [Cellulosilyticum sp.]
MTAIITTHGLSKQYGKRYSVKNIDLEVPEQGIYGFLGPNGAGKSTTLKMILGLVKQTSGEIEVFGKHFTEKNRLNILKEVGSLIEFPSYYGHLTGRENLKIIQTLRGVPEKQIDEVLRIVRLEKEQNKKVSQYSLGMKQRLGLAAALINLPKLLILDEPTNGLDPAGIQEMRELICSLPKQYGMSVVVSSHLLSEIDQMANTVGIIHHGQLIFQDQLEVLHQRHRSKLAIRTLDNDHAARVLMTEGIRLIREEEYILIPCSEDRKLGEVSKLLYENKMIPIRMEERQKSLESIFLELTGKVGSL